MQGGHDIAIRELNVMPDHVHTIVDILSNDEHFKGIEHTQRRVCIRAFQTPAKVQAALYKRALLERGKVFYRGIGDVDLETAAEYVRNQRQKHSHQTTLMRFGS